MFIFLLTFQFLQNSLTKNFIFEKVNEIELFLFTNLKLDNIKLIIIKIKLSYEHLEYK